MYTHTHTHTHTHLSMSASVSIRRRTVSMVMKFLPKKGYAALCVMRVHILVIVQKALEISHTRTAHFCASLSTHFSPVHVLEFMLKFAPLVDLLALFCNLLFEFGLRVYV
jgi:hypothetical protein